MKFPCIKMSKYFPEPYEPFGRDKVNVMLKLFVSVKVDLSNYAANVDLKNATGIDSFKLAAKSDLASIKAEVDKLDYGKLKTIPVDLSKLSNLVNYEVVKKTVYDKLAAKVNNIDTSEFVLKTKYDADKSELEKRIPDTNSLVKKLDYNAMVAEIETKITTISILAATSALAAVENKITYTNSLFKKTEHKN